MWITQSWFKKYRSVLPWHFNVWQSNFMVLAGSHFSINPLHWPGILSWPLLQLPRLSRSNISRHSLNLHPPHYVDRPVSYTCNPNSFAIWGKYIYCIFFPKSELYCTISNLDWSTYFPTGTVLLLIPLAAVLIPAKIESLLIFDLRHSICVSTRSGERVLVQIYLLKKAAETLCFKVSYALQEAGNVVKLNFLLLPGLISYSTVMKPNSWKPT